jgi:hypothetical protein
VLTTITGTNGSDTVSDGVAAGLVTFHALDQNGQPMAGVDLAFTTDSVTAVLGLPSGVSDASGDAPASVTNTVLELVTITATAAGVSGMATVNFI